MKQEEALRKVAALLNLSKRGGTTEEAATALAMAQKLMDKYQIAIEDADFDENAAKLEAEPVTDFGYSDPLDKAKRRHYEDTWSIRLASLLARYNGCVARYERTAAEYSTLKLVGRPTDVQTVRYLYGFFKQQVLNLRADCCVGQSSAYRGQFCAGVIDAITEKFEASRKETFEQKRQEHAGNALALVRVNNAIEKVDQRLKDVNEFLDQDMNKSLACYCGCNVQSILMFKRGEAYNESCLISKEQWAEARRSFNAWDKRSGRGFNGSNVAHAGRSHGQREGKNVRMTGAKAGLGSGAKAIGGAK